MAIKKDFKIGNKVRSLVDMDFIDKIDISKPHEIFNFSESPEAQPMIGIKNGKFWYYISPNDLEHWVD